jgi:hypothetical protein
MTEAEWLACRDPDRMLKSMRYQVARRKYYLYAIACCSRIEDLLQDNESRQLLTLTERYAEKLIDDRELYRGHRACFDSARSQQCLSAHVAGLAVSHLGDSNPRHAAIGSARAVSEVVAYKAVSPDDGMPYAEAYETVAFKTAAAAERAEQANLLREILGYPFHETTADPSWLTSTVTSLAQAIYADRAFDRLPILADALEDAGCTNQDILAHCRGGEHVRGCWVVDLLLAKE